jgi:hypothetical protein
MSDLGYFKNDISEYENEVLRRLIFKLAPAESYFEWNNKVRIQGFKEAWVMAEMWTSVSFI